jgi:hypothetical protein
LDFVALTRLFRYFAVRSSAEHKKYVGAERILESDRLIGSGFSNVARKRDPIAIADLEILP